MTHYLYSMGRLYVTKAETEAEAREKLRVMLGRTKCPNNTRTLKPIQL